MACITKSLLSLSLALPIAATANGVRVSCPQSIPSPEFTSAWLQSGWQVSTRSNLDLRAASLSEGPPAEKAFLKPEIVNKSYRWTRLEAVNSGGVWLACSYGKDELLVLGHRIVGRFTQCATEDKADAQGKLLIDLVCTASP